MNDTTLGNWIKADLAERGVPDESGLLPLTAAERAELTRLRRENTKLRTEREILKKSGGLLRHGVDEVTRFAFIDAEKARHDVAVLCRLLNVSRSGYHAWRSRPSSPRAVADEVLTEQVRAAFVDNRKVYGAPRISPASGGTPSRARRRRHPRRAQAGRPAHARRGHRGLSPAQTLVLDHRAGPARGRGP